MKLSRILWFTGLFLLAVNACQREDMSAAQDGEEILFCSNLAGASATKADVDIPDGYTIQVEMYRNGSGSIGTANYTTSGSALVAGASPLYWPAESTDQYAFRATAGSASLAEDQTTLAKLQAQDKLLGFAFISGGSDNEDEMNYRTRKQWGQAGGTNRRIPLYMKHQRSLITVILKAGVGVHREDLAHASNIKVDIFNHGPGAQTIRSYSSATTVDYTAGEGGAASGVNTTQFQAIVEPYDYKTNSTALVANIYLSGQRFSFTADNDQTAPNDSYNLVAGKNLVLTVTLNRGTDQELGISAQIVNWATTSPTTATIDDFGNQ